MKIINALKLLATLAVPALLAISCGGGDNLLGSCPSGTTPYSVAATYTQITASNIVDGCKEGLTPMNLMGQRVVSYTDMANGIITVYTSQMIALGSGPVKCNTGTLTFGPTTLDDTICNWTTTRTVEFKATGDYQVTINVTDDRSNSKTSSGSSVACPQPATCTTKFTLTMSK